MGSHMINLFLCILSSLICVWTVYFYCVILPCKPKISLPLFFVSVSIYGTVILIKRESQHNLKLQSYFSYSISCNTFLFQASFMKN